MVSREKRWIQTIDYIYKSSRNRKQKGRDDCIVINNKAIWIFVVIDF